MLQLQKYDITLNYKRGKDMYLADTLSRAHRKTNDRHAAKKDTFDVMMIDHSYPLGLDRLIAHTAEDNTLQEQAALISTFGAAIYFPSGTNW